MTEQANIMASHGFMSAARAARLMGCSIHTIYRWIRLEQVRAMQVGVHWYVAEESLRDKAGGPEAWDILCATYDGGV